MAERERDRESEKTSNEPEATEHTRSADNQGRKHSTKHTSGKAFSSCSRIGLEREKREESTRTTGCNGLKSDCKENNKSMNTTGQKETSKERMDDTCAVHETMQQGTEIWRDSSQLHDDRDNAQSCRHKCQGRESASVWDWKRVSSLERQHNESSHPSDERELQIRLCLR